MLRRIYQVEVKSPLARQIDVALLGSRQAGKAALALEVAAIFSLGWGENDLDRVMAV